MSKITDEMMNDYIDNELDSSKVDELKAELGNNEELLKKLKALKVVDNELRNMEVYSAPHNITERIMQIVTASAKAIKPKINYFFITIISVFAAAILSVFFFVFKTTENAATTQKDMQVVESAKKFISENSGTFISFFNNDKILFLGGLLTVILFLTGFFIYDSHKNFKEKLKGISH